MFGKKRLNTTIMRRPCKENHEMAKFSVRAESYKATLRTITLILAAGFLFTAGCGGDNGENGTTDDASIDGEVHDGDITDGDIHDASETDAVNGEPDTGVDPDAYVPISDKDLAANTYYLSDQLSPSTSAVGDYAVAVWTDYHSLDQDGSAVVYRLFASNGAARVNKSTDYDFEALANTVYPGDQTQPDTAVAPDGTFVVVWTDASDAVNTGTNIRGRLFAADGTPRVNAITGTDEEFPVSGSLPGNQYEPKVAISDLGNFMVVWTDAGGNGDDTQGTSVMGRAFGENGSPTINPDTGDIEPFTVNSNHPGNQHEPAITSRVGASGDYVVLWTDASGWHDSSSTGISGTIFNQNGANVAGGDVAINSTKNQAQSNPAVASHGPSGFVAVWTDASGVDDPSFTGIRGRLFDSSGLPRINGVTGDENDFQINTLTSGRQQLPDVAVYPETGGFAVVWQDGSGTDGSFSGIRARLFTVNGLPHNNPVSETTNDFQVNTTTHNPQLAPAVSIPGPNILFFWEDESHTPPDTENFSIRYRVITHFF